MLPESRSLKLHADDNVAVALIDIVPGSVEVLGAESRAAVVAKQAIVRGHKMALRSIADGDAVVKYGVSIGYATSLIGAGEWVHTHNCRSALDERSHTLDPHSGAPTDTRYV